MTAAAPNIGMVVHYVSLGSADGQYPATCRAAIVTEIDTAPVSLGGQRIGLAVINPAGIFLRSLGEGGARYHDGAETPGAADCGAKASHGNPFRYCACGWAEARLVGSTWHHIH